MVRPPLAFLSQTVVLSHLSACANGSDDYTSWVEDVKMHLSRPSPCGKRLDGISTTFRELQEAHTGKALRMSPNGRCIHQTKGV
jgi:hypothetical protein